MSFYLLQKIKFFIFLDDLPRVVLDLPTPDGITLAAEYKYNPVHELEGDIEALKLVDLVSLILIIISE